MNDVTYTQEQLQKVLVNDSNHISNLLQTHEVVLGYKKLDGTERDVRATLKPDLLPEVTSPVQTGGAKVKDTHVTVYDTEKMNWRTLIVANIQYIRSF
jgi:hypothetical protein|tara:strand:- start:161 stop:454 length:294 start_codon:yes stop_codon:yes gene_type:complete